MSVYLIEGEILQDIADAVREKKGSTEAILTENMATEIRGISAGTGGDDKFKQLLNGTITEVTAEDLQGSETIKAYQFYDQNALVSVDFPSTIRSVDKFAFCSCGDLENLQFNEGLETIGDSSFENCASKKFVGAVLPSSLLSIGISAFAKCSYLASITIPVSTMSIGATAFNTCRRLKNVVVKAYPPPEIQSDTFKSVNASCVYTVPVGTGNVFKSETNWSALASKIVEGEVAGVRELQPEEGDYLFKNTILSAEGEDYTLPAPSPNETYTLYLKGVEVATATPELSEFGDVGFLRFRDGCIYYMSSAWYGGDGVTEYSVLRRT